MAKAIRRLSWSIVAAWVVFAREDRQILKFSSDGKPLMQIGRSVTGPDNNQETAYVDRVAAIRVPCERFNHESR